MIRYISSDGLKIAVETFGYGPAVVFGHGLTGNRHWSRKQLSPLADSYRLVIYDQRGHCDSSPVTDPLLYAPQRMAEDVGAILDAEAIQRAVVGGDSMGSATALLYAVAHPDRVRALLLSLPALADRPNDGREAMKEWGRSIARLGIERFARNNQDAESQSGRGAEGAAAWADVLRSHQTESLATALQTVADWVILPDLTPLTHLNVPVQLIAVRNDPIHSLALAERMASALPDARLEVLPSADVLFADPQVVGRIFRHFLDSLPNLRTD